ncbi:MAG: glycosyltransferase [Magnetococcales bacterium]|nr:glycosyltransferase [Magnetococcales bacterium]
MSTLGFCLFATSFAAIFLLFAGYPLLLRLGALLLGERPHRLDESWRPRVSLIVVARNAEKLAAAKVANFQRLDYPPELLEMLFYSDGSTDGTVARVAALAEPRVRILAEAAHLGKHVGLERAAAAASGEILLFTDVDAELDPATPRLLVRHLADPAVGGVCGQRLIHKGDSGRLGEAQSGYISWDSGIKRLESRLGSITSNDGKVYAIRRELFRGIAPAVTDDLYNALAVIRQGRRFLFEPAACAWIRLPSRDPAHEVSRRSRIVARGLRGIWLHRALFHPGRYGLFGLGLFLNKVVRRLLPLLAILLVVATALLAGDHPPMRLFLGLQGLFLLLALSHPLFFARMRTGRVASVVERQASRAWYLCLGMAGTLVGVVNFLTGEVVEKWDPVKGP